VTALRTDALLDAAIALSRWGAYVDMDTLDPGLGW
jgi:hypothetical protein